LCFYGFPKNHYQLGCVDTIFFEKHIKRDKKEQPMRKQYNWTIEENERWSTQLANELVGQTSRPMVSRRID
jgi:hypothetical protein